MKTMHLENLVKPPKLNPGDTVAAVSLSWGGAGDPDLLWRYELGKWRLKDVFGLNVVEMPNALKGTDYVRRHPEARAADLMAAFADPAVKGIFSCIGGNDSIRMLPYIDFGMIRANPKVFLGYSDSTVTHFICQKAGLASFYGASILAEFAENVSIFDYTRVQIEKVLFSAEPVGMVAPAPEWTGERIEWTIENRERVKAMQSNPGPALLQGSGRVRGRLTGGCLEVLEMLKGTALWPELSRFDDAILFFETSEDMPEPQWVRYWLRNYGAQGILQRVRGIAWGIPYAGRFRDEYQAVIRAELAEWGLPELPVLYGLNFGHTEPMCCLPYGALAEIDCVARTFSVLESGVV